MSRDEIISKEICNDNIVINAMYQDKWWELDKHATCNSLTTIS